MSDLRVAIDGRRLQDRPLGGVGRAIACMLPHLVGRCEPTVLCDASRPVPERGTEGIAVSRLARPRGAPEAAWLHWSARRWNGRAGQVFHGTFNAIPFGMAGPSVVTIYDLTFELHAEDFDTPRRRLMQQWFRLNARYAAAHADVVVTASRFAADTIAERYRVAPDRLVVIPITSDPCFSPEAAQRAPAVLARLGVDRPYVVAVGGAPRRGAETAVEAWQQVRRRGVDVDLLVLGRVDAPPQRGLHLLGGLSDDEWAAVLAAAEALCYPTRYEGFGLPGLEAAASGTPVVATRSSSVPEVLGDAAKWTDGGSAEAVAAALEEVLRDSALAAQLRERGLSHVAAWPGWDEIARRHAEVYAQVP